MPTIDPVAAVSSAPTTALPAAPKQSLDSEVFLHLLVTQMKNQDPSSPLDTNEMMAQTTQLAMMEQLTALSDSFSESFALSMRQAAAALVGQHASYVDADGVTQSGLVSKVSFEQGVPTVTIGDATVPLDAVSGVTAS
ncbi:flagellar hook capping protein [Microbacterium sp. zg.Y625]|uniref:flagellar hook assembly protein FlgD n=1 Tax=Microbacterium jiangjiandongii TaxID=3049071 RepID=UPI00214C094E|nr:MULTISPECIES: flagellar hook capping FlgD N-terminal domain-containing protein [unclassified Microbacterium]MCR2793222.1 flagellar hook capping protein [Microbacterium sp. zg.Y625]MCR2815601.1 flagellar hook capping protein [Microbacterium sp. zg.Y843]WIM25399.1 flagellar hook capping FlgD N-terminal domain-containing protein [Microbacterium sp. zg-Y625]